MRTIRHATALAVALLAGATALAPLPTQAEDDVPMSDTHYATMGVGTDEFGGPMPGVPVPIRFTITRDGQVAGVPTASSTPAPPTSTNADTSATPTDDSSPSEGDSPSGTGSAAPTSSTGSQSKGSSHSTLAAFGGLVALGCIGAGVWAGIHRRR